MITVNLSSIHEKPARALKTVAKNATKKNTKKRTNEISLANEDTRMDRDIELIMYHISRYCDVMKIILFLFIFIFLYRTKDRYRGRKCIL